MTATVPVTTKVELGAGPASSTSTSSTTTVESSGPRPSTAGTDAPTTTRDAVSPATTIAPPNSSPVSSAPATTVAAPSTACQSLWVDLDGNGKQDAGEDALASVTVELTDPGLDGAFGNADDVKVTATTDATGQYCVTMAQGVYRMRIISGLPAKYSVLAKQSFKVQVKGLEISRAADGATFGAEGSSAAAAPSGAPVDNLPFTGSQSSRQIVLALAALAFGVSLFLVTRRRGRHKRQM